MSTMRPSARLAVTGLAVLAMASCSTATGTRDTSTVMAPVTSLHYTPNNNFSQSGQYLPRAYGFNLADIGAHAKAEMDRLPAGVRGLVFLGDCGGATASFRSTVDAFAGDPKLFGFYVKDEPTPSSCPAAKLLAEDDWIHAHVPGALTFAILQNLGRATRPTYAGSYTPQNSGLNLIGLDPYPVRSELRSPDYAEIARYVKMVEASGWPRSSIVPVYQAFGGGSSYDDGNGHWVLPTAVQERRLLAEWKAVVPHPEFDFTYSWGSQDGDRALDQSPALAAVFAAKNAGSKLQRVMSRKPRAVQIPGMAATRGAAANTITATAEVVAVVTKMTNQAVCAGLGPGQAGSAC